MASATLRPWFASNSATSSRLIESEAWALRRGSHCRGRRGAPAFHVRAIAPDGVDLSVVRQHAQRLGPMP